VGRSPRGFTRASPGFHPEILRAHPTLDLGSSVALCGCARVVQSMAPLRAQEKGGAQKVFSEMLQRHTMAAGRITRRAQRGEAVLRHDDSVGLGSCRGVRLKARSQQGDKRKAPHGGVAVD
jgi:hypothetical protein